MTSTSQFGKSRRYQALLIFSFALLVRVSYIAVVTPDFAQWPDSRHNESIAWRLAQGKGFDDPSEDPPAIYRPPLAPLLIASIYRIVGRSPVTVQAVQALLGAAGVMALFLCSIRVVPRTLAVLVGLASAVYPYFVYTAGTFYPEALGIPLVAVCALFFIINIQLPTMERAGMAILGLTCGLCALCRPNWLLSIQLLIPLVYICRFLYGRKVSVRAVLFGYAVWLVIWTPWTVRNSFTYGAVIPITASGGRNFYLGNMPDTKWNSKTAVSIPPQVLDWEHRLRSDPAELERRFYAMGWQFIRSDPKRYVFLWMGKLFHLWQPIPSIKDHRISVYKVVLAAGPYTITLVGALFGLVIAAKSRKWELLGLLTVVILDGALVAVFITPARLRLPFDSILMLFCAVAVDWVSHRYRLLPGHRHKEPS